MKKAIMFFCTGELFWEFGRFAPHFIWKRKKQYKKQDDIKFIVMTKPENFDIYGRYADILVPFRLKNESKYRPNCFRLDNMKEQEYLTIISLFKKQFQDRFKIIDFIYPNVSKKQYTNKNQFPKNEMNYDYLPRKSNQEIIQKYMNGKPVVILAPRYREGLKRNWSYWDQLYDMIWETKELIEKYNFIICGRYPDYIPDYKNRFLDINKMDQNINTSLIGLTIECMKKSILTIGSQSAIPNISLLFDVPVLEWGHQKYLHTVTYNIKNTKITFLEDLTYSISPKIIYHEIIKILK